MNLYMDEQNIKEMFEPIKNTKTNKVKYADPYGLGDLLPPTSKGTNHKSTYA